MENYRNTLGFVIVLVGVAILLSKFGVIGSLGSLFWPVFVLVPGLVFHALYFGRVLPSGVLIPGGILITYSAMFFFCNLFGWDWMKYLWPGFIFGVAVGLYEFYLFDRHNPKGAFVASLILTVISGVLFGFTLLFTASVYFIALALIAVGLFMIYRRPKAW